MDSFQKRQRERGKIEKRQEKEARKKERAEQLSQRPLDADGVPLPLEPEEFPAADDATVTPVSEDNRS